MNLAKVLKERGDATEKDRQSLVQVEKDMCSLACMRMRLSEEAARSEAGLTEQQIKVTQLDRDLQVSLKNFTFSSWTNILCHPLTLFSMFIVLRCVEVIFAFKAEKRTPFLL